MKGYGAALALDCAPNPLAFGMVRPGKAKTLDVQLINAEMAQTVQLSVSGDYVLPQGTTVDLPAHQETTVQASSSLRSWARSTAR
jgi:hypothetical protein